MVRGYEQRKRGEAAEETRRRIVSATYELHGEQGIANTSMKQIAQRAGVSVGSVYHHFPTYDDAVRACGAHAYALAPPPAADLLAGVAERAERVRRLARAQFAFYAGVRAFGHVIADQERVPALKDFVEQDRRGRAELATAAVGNAASAALAALIDHRTYEALRDQGFSPTTAADRVAALVNAWLDAIPERKEIP